MMYQLIDSLPNNAKATALYSIVGSLNASILYGAQFIARSCDAHGEDVHEEIGNDFPRARYEAQQAAKQGQMHDRFVDLQAMVAFRDELHTKLMEARNAAEEVLPLHATLQFLTTAVRDVPKEQIEELVNALGIEGLNTDDIRSVYKLDAELRRAELAATSERVLSVAMAIPPLPGVEDNAFDALSSTKQNALWCKLETALNKARNNVVVGVLNRRTVDLGDIPLINDALKEVKTMIRNTSDIRLAA